MYAEVAWILVSSGTQVQPQIIPDPDYLPDYLSIPYDYDNIEDIIVTFLMNEAVNWMYMFMENTYQYTCAKYNSLHWWIKRKGLFKYSH